MLSRGLILIKHFIKQTNEDRRHGSLQRFNPLFRHTGRDLNLYFENFIVYCCRKIFCVTQVFKKSISKLNQD